MFAKGYEKGRNKTGNIVFTHSCISTAVVSTALYITVCRNTGMGKDNIIPGLVSIPFPLKLYLHLYLVCCNNQPYSYTIIVVGVESGGWMHGSIRIL